MCLFRAHGPPSVSGKVSFPFAQGFDLVTLHLQRINQHWHQGELLHYSAMDQAESKITSHHAENSLEASSEILTVERDTVQSWADELTKNFQTNRFSR